MAIVWESVRDGVQYQVRKAGQSLRLYTDGVLHSQYHPERCLTGSVWDLLFLPALALPENKKLDVLVLGVGGGAVMHMVNEFFTVNSVTGIELNPVHIEIAENAFGISGKPFNLIEADAVGWVKEYRGRKFDLIIDDLFREEDGEPVKVVAPDNTWFFHLFGMLKPGGVIVMNFVGKKEAMKSAPLHDEVVGRMLPDAVHLTTPYYDNHVMGFSRIDLSDRIIRSRINTHPELSGLKNYLRFSCRSVHKKRSA